MSPGLFRIAVSAVIVNKNNEVLLTQRSFERDHHPGMWETISGRLNEGEDFETGLKREIKIEKPISTFHFFRGSGREEHLGVNFLCRHLSGDVKVDGVEEIDYQWVQISKALEIVDDESILNSLQLVQNLLK